MSRLRISLMMVALLGACVLLYRRSPAVRYRQWIIPDPELPVPRGGRVGDAYLNPVGRDIDLADPYVLFAGGQYFLFGTRGRGGFLSAHSPDLVAWQKDGYYYDTVWHSYCTRSFWAPEVHSYHGAFYLMYSCERRSGFLFEAPPEFRLVLAKGESPVGPFADLEVPWLGSLDAIDPHLFVDDDGRAYAYFVRVGAKDGHIFGRTWGVELEADLRHAKGEPQLLLQAAAGWEIADPKNETNEGPAVFKREGSYYLTYSANSALSANYAVGYARAESPLGPWIKSPHNPVLSSDLSLHVKGPGHASVTRSPDGVEWFLVYHSFEPDTPGMYVKNINIDRITFDAAGDLTVVGPTRSPQPLPRGIAARPHQ